MSSGLPTPVSTGEAVEGATAGPPAAAQTAPAGGRTQQERVGSQGWACADLAQTMNAPIHATLTCKSPSGERRLTACCIPRPAGNKTNVPSWLDDLGRPIE